MYQNEVDHNDILFIQGTIEMKSSQRPSNGVEEPSQVGHVPSKATELKRRQFGHRSYVAVPGPVIEDPRHCHRQFGQFGPLA